MTCRTRKQQCAHATLHVKEEEHHRWSEVIPPHTALSFAVIFEPDEGIVSFSGAQLLDAEPCPGKGGTRFAMSDAPADAFDSQSQVLTIDRFALARGFGGSSLHTAGLDTCEGYTDIIEGIIDAYLEDNNNVCPGRPPGIPPTPRSAALASSAALVSFVHHDVGAEAPHVSSTSHEMNTVKSTITPLRIGRRIFPAIGGVPAKLFMHRGCRRDSSSSQNVQTIVHDEGFFEDSRRLTSGTFGTAPVLVNLNLVSSQVFATLFHLQICGRMELHELNVRSCVC